MSHRLYQINSVIKRQLAEILPFYISEYKHILVTVMDVETNRDLSLVKVWISIFNAGSEEEKLHIVQKFQNNIYDIQGQLNTHIKLKKVPKIVFKIDDSGETISRLQKIFNEGGK